MSIQTSANASTPVYVTTPGGFAQVILNFTRQHTQSGQRRVALDTEPNGDDPHASTLFTLQLFVPGLGPIVADLRTVLTDQTRQMLVDYFAQPGLLKQFQNGKFDLKMLAAIGIPVPPPYFDTMLVSQILVCGQQEGSKLGDLSQRYLGVTLDKRLQTSFLGLPPDAVLSQEQVEYGADDVVVLPKLQPPMQAALNKHPGNVRTWSREQGFLPVLAAMEAGGVRFRAEGLEQLEQRLNQKTAVAKRYAEGHLVGTPAIWGGYDSVNLDSSQSVKEAVLAQDIPYSSDKNSDLLRQAGQPGVMYLLEYRYLKQQLEQLQQWQQLLLRTHRGREVMQAGVGQGKQACGGQFHLLASYSQVGYMNGRLSHSRTGIEVLMPKLDDEQEPWVSRLLLPRSDGNKLIGQRLKEAPLRVLAQVTGDATLNRIYAEGELAIDWLCKQIEIEPVIAWALWMGCGLYGYRKAAKWQEFCYDQTGVALPIQKAKGYVDQFWGLLPELKVWHQQHPTSKERSFTLSGRYCHNYRDSHADQMAHRVLGSLDDLVKAAATEIDQALQLLGGVPYLVLGDYLVWEVPAERQQELLELACEVLIERSRVMLPNVVKAWNASNLNGV